MDQDSYLKAHSQGASRSCTVSATVSPALHATEFPVSEWKRVEAVWSMLAARTQSSFFLDAEWIGTWLATFGSCLSVSIIVFDDQTEPIAAALLVHTRGRRLSGALRRISLNASGEDAADTTYVEFNRLLCLPGWENAVAGAIADHLSGAQWDEFAVDGFLPGAGYDALRRALTPLVPQELRHRSYYVDLAGLRRSGSSYEQALSSHRRKLLRQNLRAYSACGPLQLERAHDLAEAQSLFLELALFNRQRQAACGRESVFHSERFLRFHQELILRSFAAATVQLLRVTAGPKTIGVLYNFVQNGRVYFYQCGFDYSTDPRLSPGFVSLTLAIQHYLDQGMDTWEFLSGDAEYKRILSTGSSDLIWAVFRKPNWRTALIRGARSVKALRGWMIAERKGADHVELS